MSLLQPLGLLGLLGIPIIILIYLLKSKYVQKPVSSTFIWKRSLKYVKTRLPINFIFSLLLILQLLTVIFASLAISRPTILPFKAKDTVIILDASASMMTVNSDGKTRYELALEEIEKTADKAGENNKITVISAGNTPETQVFRSADKVEIINAIEDLVCDDGTGDIDGALVLASNVQNMNPDTNVIFYTDKDYFDADGVEIRVDQETFTGRFEMAPLDEITLGYEAQWNGACHTLVSPEWSVWIDEDDDDFIINVGRKVDDRAL